VIDIRALVVFSVQYIRNFRSIIHTTVYGNKGGTQLWFTRERHPPFIPLVAQAPPFRPILRADDLSFDNK
jgi:hypothetical protein